ncbi:cell division protein FtsW, lipid II flippase [Anaerosphaera aminiphila DSM 21120]|uniref:Cell division protein FtsW, lipid II flippase n=1 Tax=Anaerosphaera aminiphila DSM 21120 TaxID=1120995 RepID=A0A1M5P6T8_9FIRM|nr:FtsW/RodA/SpoVE family cell cycle protein [Anaerosphaera aminiphila]SHG97472.1 cell division protein FtsW, lipid II flippase [Anaerosphaera aminiphila DSM 21120]
MLDKVLKTRRPRDLLLVFELLTVLLLFLFNNTNVDKYIVILFLGLILIIYISNFILGRVSTGDNYLFLIVSMLMTIGIITIYRINPDLGIKQLVWILVGISVFYITYFAIRGLRKLEKLTLIYLGISILLFLATAIFGREINGAKNWIKIGSFSFQPSEITKILLIFLIASYYTDFQYKIDKRFKYRPYVLMVVVYFLIGLLFLQRDLGTAVIFWSIFTGVQFIYEEDKKALFINIGSMAIGALAGYFLFNHVRVRVDIWLNPWTEKNIYGNGRQIVQSLFAIAEGGFFGTGIGLGYPKLLPVVESDSIFPLICEEMGIFAGIGIIMLFMLLTYRGIKIAIKQEYKFYRILAICVSILFAVQAFLNIGGMIKLIPMTGLTLPFISYGGTSILSSFMALAILQVASEDMSYKYE